VAAFGKTLATEHRHRLNPTGCGLKGGRGSVGRQPATHLKCRSNSDAMTDRIIPADDRSARCMSRDFDRVIARAFCARHFFECAYIRAVLHRQHFGYDKQSPLSDKIWHYRQSSQTSKSPTYTSRCEIPAIGFPKAQLFSQNPVVSGCSRSGAYLSFCYLNPIAAKYVEPIETINSGLFSHFGGSRGCSRIRTS
jgi:hypothetical protein